MMGPVISAAQRDKCERYVQLAEEHGGKVFCGGGRPAGLDRGYYFEPTVLDLPSNANPAAQEEIFGPIIGVLGYRDIDDAVAIANDSIYGLSGQVYGADAAAAVQRGTPAAHRCGQRQHQRLLGVRAERGLQAERAGPRTRPGRYPRISGGQAHVDWRVEMSPEANGHKTYNLDWLISVDDHILEPPNLWVDRVAAKDRDRAPHMEVDDNGMDVWVYDGKRMPSSGLSAVVGKSKEEFSPEPLNLLRDAARAATTPRRASRTWTAPVCLRRCAFRLCTRFCGQLFMEASDREFGFECLQIYNDWLVEEWCGAAPGRYIPLMLIPMWDPALAVKEMERMAAKGVTAFAFSENPEPLGLPTIHDVDHYWEPVMAAANELETGREHARRLVVDAAQDLQRRAVHGQPHLGRLAHLGNDAVLALQRAVPALPEPEDRPVRRRMRLDALLPGARRAGAGQAAVLGEARDEVHGPRR